MASEGVLLFVVIDLILDNVGRNVDIARIAQQQVVLQLMDNVLLNSKGIHYHVVPAMEFNKVKASEGGRVLILVASGDSQIQAFHAVGQIRHP